MTSIDSAQPAEPETTAPPKKHLPLITFFRNLDIGPKLTIGFGTLVALIILVIAINYQGSRGALVNINRTEDTRVPIALRSASAQANLLRMLASTRAYLALGDDQYIDGYYAAEEAFVADMNALEELAQEREMSALNRFRLQKLTEAFAAWQPLPEQLFILRRDPFEREPAYRIVNTEGATYGGEVLIAIRQMIESQALRQPSSVNVELLKDMANFQGSFATMLSGLRNYVTTQNRIFRQEYEANLVLNEFAWSTLENKAERGLLTESQETLLATIEQNREQFLGLPEEQIFPILEGERSREDLYLFTNEAVPLNELMLDLLNEMTADQQDLLRADLNAGRRELNTAVSQTLTFGLLAVVLGGIMSWLLRDLIAGPVHRLTGVAEQIRAGDLDAQAQVESADEIGVLAQTFNRMTTRLRQTLEQVTREKKRADDLLNVVIPIGVDLTQEKDFNRLLEKMLLEAKTFCRANAGTLYLRTAEDTLQFAIMRNDSQDMALGGTTGNEVPFASLPLYEDGRPIRRHVATHAAISGQTINIPDARQAEAYTFAGLEDDYGYFPISYLTIPLKNSEEEVIGVLQLLDAQDPETGVYIPFDPNLQQMMESFSSLAVAALEGYMRERELRQEIQQLRIEIDEAKKQKQVEEIVDTDFFSDLRAKAKELRQRNRPRDQQEE